MSILPLRSSSGGDEDGGDVDDENLCIFLLLCHIMWFNQSSIWNSIKRPSDYHNDDDNCNMIAIGDRKGGEEFESKSILIVDDEVLNIEVL